ncbi:MAG TPA: hypothetical protein VIX82_03495 [Solirubrobacteraceae bacterium]
MSDIRRSEGSAVAAALVGLLCSLAIAGCGDGSGDAAKLLRETFTAQHTISSGVLEVQLTIDPAGSSTFHGPITLSFGGPFQSLGSGRLPRSDFTLGLSGSGFRGSLGILSTGTAGYVTVKGVSYQLPQASFQRLESSFAAAATPSGAGIFSHLAAALTNATVVGEESVAGAGTTHIRAGVNVPAALADVSTVLRQASSIGVSGSHRLAVGLSPAAQRRIAGEVKNPTFDLWTGTHDKTLRRLQLGATLAVSGQVGQLLGSRSVDLGLSIQYSALNQPQAITAPATVRPFREFAATLRALQQKLQGALGGAG